jgi:hypothetical protein
VTFGPEPALTPEAFVTLAGEIAGTTLRPTGFRVPLAEGEAVLPSLRRLFDRLEERAGPRVL